MKRNTLFTLILATTIMSAGWAQGVGINTTNPQEALHIGGENASIRVDGLNSVNNLRNAGGSDMYNVMVDANGNLALGEISGELSSESLTASPVMLQTTTSAGSKSAEIYSKSFTLNQRAIVVVTYYTSLEFESYDGASKVEDGRAKVAHNYWYLGDGTTPDISKSYGMSSMVYSNANCDTASGYMYNSRTVTIPLNRGTYSIHLNGAVDGGGSGSDASFRVTFGDMDRLDISVMYL